MSGETREQLGSGRRVGWDAAKPHPTTLKLGVLRGLGVGSCTLLKSRKGEETTLGRVAASRSLQNIAEALSGFSGGKKKLQVCFLNSSGLSWSRGWCKLRVGNLLSRCEPSTPLQPQPSIMLKTYACITSGVG